MTFKLKQLFLHTIMNNFLPVTSLTLRPSKKPLCQFSLSGRCTPRLPPPNATEMKAEEKITDLINLVKTSKHCVDDKQ